MCSYILQKTMLDRTRNHSLPGDLRLKFPISHKPDVFTTLTRISLGVEEMLPLNLLKVIYMPAVSFWGLSIVNRRFLRSSSDLVEIFKLQEYANSGYFQNVQAVYLMYVTDWSWASIMRLSLLMLWAMSPTAFGNWYSALPNIFDLCLKFDQACHLFYASTKLNVCNMPQSRLAGRFLS